MACNGMYRHIYPKKPRIHESCIGMYWHVLTCINIYTPKKPRIHEMYWHVMACIEYQHIYPKKVEFMNVLACNGMYRHIYPQKT